MEELPATRSGTDHPARPLDAASPSDASSSAFKGSSGMLPAFRMAEITSVFNRLASVAAPALRSVEMSAAFSRLASVAAPALRSVEMSAAFSRLASVAAPALRSVEMSAAFSKLASGLTAPALRSVEMSAAFSRLASVAAPALRSVEMSTAFSKLASGLTAPALRSVEMSAAFSRLASVAAPALRSVEMSTAFSKLASGLTAPALRSVEMSAAFSRLASLSMPTTRIMELSALASSIDRIKWASLEQVIGDYTGAIDAEVTVTEEEVEQSLSDMPWQRPDFASLDLADQMNRLVEALQQQTALLTEQAASGQKIGRKDIKLSVLQAIIKVIVERIWLSLIVLILGLFSAPRPAEVVHEVRTIIREVPALRDEAKNYRIVGKGKVIAFQRPKTKSARVGPLVPGQMVRVVQKQKEWCLVEWQNEHGSDVRGWVKSKRLGRI